MSTERAVQSIVLAKGGHDSPEDGLCLMEAVAFIRGIPHTDRPPCVSPVLGDFGRNLNDALPDDTRQLLTPLIPVLPGTADDGFDEQRGYMALDWLIRAWLPTWLDLVPSCVEDAAALRSLGQIVDLVSAERAGPVVKESQRKSAAAGAAAGDAALDAAWDAAWDAAGAAARAAALDAAWDAARAAAWDAALDAAWDAARAAAWDAALDAALDAAWDAAWDAARAAARAAAGDAAGDAARDAARERLAPTVAELQQSAIDLYTRMATVGGAS